jgi:uncharacterized repeat protein (TIGR01451 family)
MSRVTVRITLAAATAALGIAGWAEASAPVDPIVVKTTAELEKHVVEQGHALVKLLPADRVVAGDQVLYTLEVRNAGATAADNVSFTAPIPEHMVYVEDSAAGPGAAIAYSVDGGRSFDVPEKLFVRGADGKAHAAVAADYTHIRFTLGHRLKADSVAFARFRAILK